MWALYVLAVIGATALVELLACGVNKVIDLFAKIDSIDRQYENIDNRYWGHERCLASIYNELQSIHNNISDLSTRMDAAETSIRGTKKEDSENA